jgi:hypothetical protein
VQEKPNNSELLFQIERFLSFLWAGGGTYSDYYIHQIDACCWMKDAWPEKAHALGGLHYRHPAVDQNLDTYSVEYTYPDGTKLFYATRSSTTSMSSLQTSTSSPSIPRPRCSQTPTASTPSRCRVSERSENTDFGHFSPIAGTGR